MAEAERAVSEANERAARLEKEAASARGRTADIERLTAWRHVPLERRQEIVDSLRHVADSLDVLIEYQIGDPEAFSYGREIGKLFSDAGVKRIREASNSYIATSVFGLHLAAASEISASFIASALSVRPETLRVI